MIQNQLYFEDVHPGLELPVIALSVTFHKAAMTQYSTWDFFPGHHDPDYARGQGQKTIYLNTLALQGFADRVVTDWAGPATFIARRRMTMKASVYAGDTLTGGGKVERVGMEDGRRCIALGVWLRTEAGAVCDVETTIVLPSRAEPRPTAPLQE